jgi:DNA-directed RNA polymerase I, II, and III subunit RPABC1
MSINVEYSNAEIVRIAMENVLKMLERRNMIKSWKTVYSKLPDDFTSKSSFELEMDNKSKVGIYMVNAKLSSIVMKTPLDDYLSNNIEVHKIIICKDVAKKVVKQIITEYSNAEFFFESEFMEDIPSKVFIPKHELLNGEEKTELLSKFSETELSKILVTDMMSRYYGAKIGDIFRIIRPSFTAGMNIFYRRVVNGTLDVLFDS